MNLAVSTVAFDLPDDATAPHLAWLEEVALPAYRVLPGVSWVALYRKVITTLDNHALTQRVRVDPDAPVGGGRQFHLFLGASDSDAFFAPQHVAARQRFDAAHPERVSERSGTRSSILLQETCRNGPAVADHLASTGPAPVLQFGTFNVDHHTDEFELGAFYRYGRFAAVAQTPGCVVARKFVALAGWAKHGFWLEFTSLEERAAHYEAEVELGTHREFASSESKHIWQGRHPTEFIHFPPGSPNVLERLYP